MSKQYHISPSAVRQVSCPHCAHIVYYYDDKSEFFGCPDCLCFFRKDSNGQTTFTRQFLKEDSCKLVMQPGHKGTIEGRQYQVAGVLQKNDYSGNRWREYLLTSPGQENYRVLSEYNGQWIFLWPVEAAKHSVGRAGVGAHYREAARGEDAGRIFERYQKYMFRVVFAVGEFDWNAPEDEEKVKAAEYIDPPDMLVCESVGKEQAWYRGTHISKEDVRAAFDLSYSDMPVKFGNGPLEVPDFYRQIGPLIRFSLLAVAFLVLSRMFISGFMPAETAVVNNFEIPADSAAQPGTGSTVRTESFRLSGNGAAMLSIIAGLDNTWMDVDAELVNEGNGRSWECSRALQYYHGIEGGEAWSEGPNNLEAVFSSVPAGTYHVNVMAYGEMGKGKNFSVSVEQNTVLYSNFWWVMLVILIYPGIQLIRKQSYENDKN